MKKILNVIIVFCLLTLSNSCGLVHYLGVKSPEAKSEDAQLHFLNKQKVGIDFYDYAFQFPIKNLDSLSTWKYGINTHKLKNDVKASPIQIHIYDSYGNILNGHSQCFGDFNRLNILSEKEYKTFEWLPINRELKLSDQLNLLDVSDEIKQEILENAFQGKKDVFYVYWNEWSNHYSKIMFRKMKEYFKKYPERKDEIIIVFVNTDGDYSIST